MEDTNTDTVQETPVTPETAQTQEAAAPETPQEAAPLKTPENMEPIRTPIEQPDAAKPRWYDDLPDELRTNPNITKYKSMEDLAKGYTEAVKQLGKKGIEPLAEGATPQEKAAYAERMRGEKIKTPSDYTYKSNEEDTRIAALKQALFDGGAPDHVASEILSKLDAADEELGRQQHEETVRYWKQEQNLLQSEWGSNYMVNKRANEMLLEKIYPQAAEAIKLTGLDKNAAFNLMLFDLNRKTADAQIRFTNARSETFDEKLDKIQTSQAYTNPQNRREYLDAAAKRAELIMKETAARRQNFGN